MGKKPVKILYIIKSEKITDIKKWYAGLVSLGYGDSFKQWKNNSENSQ